MFGVVAKALLYGCQGVLLGCLGGALWLLGCSEKVVARELLVVARVF